MADDAAAPVLIGMQSPDPHQLTASLRFLVGGKIWEIEFRESWIVFSSAQGTHGIRYIRPTTGWEETLRHYWQLRADPVPGLLEIQLIVAETS